MSEVLSEIEISVVIPAYNEEKRLPATLEQVGEYFDGRFDRWELLVVDDGSVDGTSELAGSFLSKREIGRLLVLPRNRGKGGALRVGMMAGRGRWILFMDADLSTPLEVMERMMPHFEENAVVIGSRRVSGAEIIERQPPHRRLMGHGFTMLANLLMLTSVTDFTCGFKAFRRDAAREIFGRSRIDGWGCDAEVLFLARRLGFRVKEVPVRWKNDPQSRVRVLSATAKSLLELLLVRANDFLGLYRRPPETDAILETIR